MLIARSLLFVPANRPRMLDHAVEAAADVIVLDLEDSVPVAEKPAARATLRAAIERLKGAGKTVQVRVNHLDTGFTRDDLQAAIGPGLDSIAFPKAESAAQIRELDVIIRELELKGGVRPGTALLFPQIETARGVLRCEEIAMASTRIAGLACGGEDYTRDLGVARTRDGHELDYIRRVIVHVCIANGLLPLDTVFADFRDETGLTAETEFVQSIGFKGKYLIHPSQIELVNRAFTPTDDEIQLARIRVEAYDEALARGEGSVQVDGRMIDEPVAQRARDLLAYAQAVGAISAP
jgi:citrate lyase subunit beta/citryl-CoA lyase